MLHIHVPLFHLLSCNSLLHPQVKLEHSRIVPIIPWSIPAGRGKVLSALRVGQHGRITPAWAGKSKGGSAPFTPGLDHPRVGGEKTAARHLLDFARGSPPRGRGKAIEGVALSAAHGITPAWAGKSLSRPPAGGLGWDHPRVGGEKHHPTPSNAVLRGSPPRGRGKGRFSSFFAMPSGITPAWAGKRRKSRWRDDPCRDHPRVGGEKTKKIP